MPELPGEYKDRWLEERFANIQLQLQHLRQGQEQTNVALRELREETREAMRELREETRLALTGLRDEMRGLSDKLGQVHSDDLRHFQATMRWLVGTALALSALMVVLFSLFTGTRT